MSEQELYEILEQYNWDDGFDIPIKIINSVNCSLAIALEVFYLGDGYTYLDMIKNINEGETDEWLTFISNLYNRIKDGYYKVKDLKYEVPLTKVQKYKLKKKNIDDIFLEDII